MLPGSSRHFGRRGTFSHDAQHNHPQLLFARCHPPVLIWWVDRRVARLSLEFYFPLQPVYNGSDDIHLQTLLIAHLLPQISAHLFVALTLTGCFFSACPFVRLSQTAFRHVDI